VLLTDTLIDLNDGFSNLALLTWWLNHSSLDSRHACFHILDIPCDFHCMGLMLILVSLEENLEFYFNSVNWLMMGFWWNLGLVGPFEVRTTKSLTLVLDQNIDHFDRKEVRRAWWYL
jgi:hypothetical protein